MKCKTIREKYCELRRCSCDVEYMYREQVDGGVINAVCPICEGSDRIVLKVYKGGGKN